MKIVKLISLEIIQATYSEKIKKIYRNNKKKDEEKCKEEKHFKFETSN